MILFVVQRDDHLEFPVCDLYWLKYDDKTLTWAIRCAINLRLEKTLIASPVDTPAAVADKQIVSNNSLRIIMKWKTTNAIKVSHHRLRSVTVNLGESQLIAGLSISPFSEWISMVWRKSDVHKCGGYWKTTTPRIRDEANCVPPRIEGVIVIKSDNRIISGWRSKWWPRILAKWNQECHQAKLSWSKQIKVNFSPMISSLPKHSINSVYYCAVSIPFSVRFLG